MCGIAGYLAYDHAAEQEVIARMNQAIAHRGPDGEGSFVSGPIALGHRRLAIIDLSPTGQQPMANENNSIVITFNGEIYNFAVLRDELESLGHKFRSSCDTEVIIHAYEQWGKECVSKFNGMFSFALWDETLRQLWLVRDRLGVKPLFYADTGRHFLFGSEIKALLASGLCDRTVDYEALAYFVSLNYTPAPFTLLKNVRHIMPGHWLTVSVDGKITDYEYWDLKYDEAEEKSENYYLERFEELLKSSVALRLMSDVPFGCFLSGGLDSSTIAYWMSQLMDNPVKTFSVGFSEAAFNESIYSETVAAHLNTEHFSQQVSGNIAEIIPKLVYHAEEPTADSSMIAVYKISEFARQHVAMVLTGDGADEIIAGYETCQASYLSRIYNCFPRWLRDSVIKKLVTGLPVTGKKVAWDEKARRFVNGASENWEDSHAKWRVIFDADARQKLFAPIWGNPAIRSDFVDLYRQYFAKTNAQHPLNRMLYVDTRFYLPSDMLVKVDRMAMAHGLEGRTPFLDYRLVEFLATVPPKYKLRFGIQKKYLLKKHMEGRLPQEIIYRRKQGFNMPQSQWLKQELKPYVTDVLSGDNMKSIGIFEPDTVHRLIAEHFSGQRDNGHQIWCLLNLALWWDQILERKTIAGS